MNTSTSEPGRYGVIHAMVDNLHFADKVIPLELEPVVIAIQQSLIYLLGVTVGFDVRFVELTKRIEALERELELDSR